MFVDQFYISCLSQASYLVGDESAGEAVVVDPRRDVEEYLDRARARGVRIVGILNTHFHADFVSGHHELQALTGAWIGFGALADPEYTIRRFTHRERLQLGDTALEILETPGHTWESICIAVHESRRVTAVFTGDTLLLGDVGRPDLAASVGADPVALAQAAFRSINETLLALPDDVTVYPAHGAGSACGRNLSTELQSTIGEQRLANPRLSEPDMNSFVADLLAGQPPIPRYFAANAMLNRRIGGLTRPETPPCWLSKAPPMRWGEEQRSLTRAHRQSSRADTFPDRSMLGWMADSPRRRECSSAPVPDYSWWRRTNDGWKPRNVSAGLESTTSPASSTTEIWKR